MEDIKPTTLERIHIAAKREFLEKGFLGASLRNIVKCAGVTTGAFYGYYDSKEKNCLTRWCLSSMSMSWICI